MKETPVCKANKNKKYTDIILMHVSLSDTNEGDVKDEAHTIALISKQELYIGSQYLRLRGGAELVTDLDVLVGHDNEVLHQVHAPSETDASSIPRKVGNSSDLEIIRGVITDNSPRQEELAYEIDFIGKKQNESDAISILGDLPTGFNEVNCEVIYPTMRNYF
jgi:hypothetical protein